MYVYYNCVMMEAVGDVTAARTKRFNVMYVYKCVRQPGFVYEFFHRKNNSYTCKGCSKQRKTRSITIVDEKVVVSSTHPEDGHVCQAIPEAGLFKFRRAI